MKKIISKIMLFLFIFSITLSGLNNNVHADANKHRIYGNDRIQTSIKISQDGWANGAETAIIAQGYGYADALCAAPLAKKHNAPIILSEKNGLNAEIINELKRLKVKKVFIIGGTGVLSESVESQLSNTGIKSVERLWGKDRYETSVKVAESLGPVEGIVITSGNGYADSLSIAPIAAQKGMPILLSEKDKLADVTQNYIKKMNVKKCYVVGGTGVISDNVKKFVTDSERLSGKDRFETNLAVLQRFQNELKFENIFIAQGDGPTGTEFADALSGSALAAQKSSPVILIYKTIYNKTAEFIKTKMSKDSRLIALGGTAVVPNDILDAVIDLFNGKTPGSGIGNPADTTTGGGGGGVVIDPPKGNAFNLVITKGNGAKTLKSKVVNVESNKNAMDYLKDVADVAELQGKGFINGIDGLINVDIKDLSVADRKAGLLGKDWFIYLNGKLTDTGATGVKPKAGDTLNFDYHEWDWHSLMEPGYSGTIPLKLEDVPGSVNVGESIKLRVTCVYRGIYGVSIKLDGQEVATTDIDGYATIKINDSGTHKIRVEKDGGSAETEVNVLSGGGGSTPSKDDLKLNSKDQVYDGNSNGNKKDIKGNVFISADNVSLKNATIAGEIIIDPGKAGSSNITNVTANKITIKSGGADSIHFNNVKSNSLLVNSSTNVRIEAIEDTQIKSTEVVRSSILEPTKSSFGNITMINSDKSQENILELRGDFTDKINVKTNVKLIANTDKAIPQVVINSDAKVQVILEGKFENINVEKEATIIAENNTKISKIDTNANVDIKSKGKGTIGIVKQAEGVVVKCDDDSVSVVVKKDVQLVKINGNVNLIIIKTEDNTIKIKSNSTNNNDYISITLYDEKGNLSYINQSSNGTLDFDTILKSGKYHGFVKASSADIIEINEFEVK